MSIVMSRDPIDWDSARRRDKASNEPYKYAMREEKPLPEEEFLKLQTKKREKTLGERLKPVLIARIQASDEKRASVKSLATKLVDRADIHIDSKGRFHDGLIYCLFEFTSRMIESPQNSPWNRTIEFLVVLFGQHWEWVIDRSGGCPVLKMNMRLSVPADCFE